MSKLTSHTVSTKAVSGKVLTQFCLVTRIVTTSLHAKKKFVVVGMKIQENMCYDATRYDFWKLTKKL